MEYTIKKVSQISGVSARTLRYYDEIKLLIPKRISSSGYRIYGKDELDKLQQILFYRSLDFKLEDIQKILSNPGFDVEVALKEHYKNLILKRKEIDNLISTVEKTMKYKKGEIEMSDNEKFEAFKKEKLEENEKKYGSEIREKYGEEVVNKSNEKWSKLSKEDFKAMEKLEEEMFKALNTLSETKDLSSEEAKIAFEKHKAWLMYSWPNYTKEAHIGLAQMYVYDERFAKYYNDKAGKEVVELLRDAIEKYAE